LGVYEAINGNKLNSTLLVAFFFIFILVLAFFFNYLLGYGTGGLILAFVISVALSIGSYYYSDKIVLAISGAREATLEENRYLVHSIEALSLGAGIPQPKIFVIEDTAPNAFATGRNPEHAIICVTTGLLQKMNRLELEGVLAHEMSHIKNYDIRFMTLVTVMVGIVTLLSDWILRSFLWGRKNSGREEGKLGIVLIIIGLLLAILAPLIATLIKLAISRKREFLADADAALLTRYPAGLASALAKLESDTEPLEAANKATAHLYIVNPLKGQSGWLNGLFSTHPPIKERITALSKM
jgi:heat shock protein HtpX